MTQTDSLLTLIATLHAQLVQSQMDNSALRQRVAELEKTKNEP